MDPNQNDDQAGQNPGMPQGDDATGSQPTPAPEPTSNPEPSSAPEPAPEAPSGQMEEVPPPPPVVEDQPAADPAGGSQMPGSDTNQPA